MKVLGYGEDALTLWALTQKTQEILDQLKDTSNPVDCTVFFRPSFGRRGGPTSSPFGEFDFILASPRCLYLGETKWDPSPEVAETVIQLNERQIERHKIFTAYYKLWRSADTWQWPEFLKTCKSEFQKLLINKRVPPVDSVLSKNIRNILEMITEKTPNARNVRNVLLIVDSRGVVSRQNRVPPEGFHMVMLDASPQMQGGFIPIPTC